MSLRGSTKQEQRRATDSEDLSELEQKRLLLEQSLSNSEDELAGVLREVEAAEAWSRAEQQAAEVAEKAHLELREEVSHFAILGAATISGAASSSESGSKGATGAGISAASSGGITVSGALRVSACRGGHDAFGVPQQPGPLDKRSQSLPEEDWRQQLANHQLALGMTESEAAAVTHEVGAREAEIEYLRRDDLRHIHHLEEAECIARAFYQEFDGIKILLGEAELHGRVLQEEHRSVELSEGPLTDWVRHAEMELRDARAQNDTLSKQLMVALDRRAHLQRDDLESLPMRQAGLDHKSIVEHEERERQNTARKALLEEEIHEHRSRRGQLLAEAATAREEVQRQLVKSGACNASGHAFTASTTTQASTLPGDAATASLATTVASASSLQSTRSRVAEERASQGYSQRPPGQVLPALPTPMTMLPTRQDLSVQSRSLLLGRGDDQAGDHRTHFVLPEVHGSDSEGEGESYGNLPKAASYWDSLHEDEPRS